MNYLVYILFSKKLNRFYICSTSNFDERMQFHQNPEARKFTYKADDWEIFLTIDCCNKAQSLHIEKHIKRMKSNKYIEKLKSKYKEDC